MRLLIILAILLSAVGCATENPQPAVQPVIEQPTYQGQTQYDYKAGAPNEYSNQTVENVTSESTYPVPQLIHPWSYYFPEVYNPHHFESGSGGSGYSYSPPQTLPSVVFWQGSTTVTVQ